jgi:uncharacterized repeat protein (TIGR01451 family)
MRDAALSGVSIRAGVLTGVLALGLIAPASAATQADVSISETGPSHVVANTDITYHITTTNAGPDGADNVTTTDTPPANTTLVSFTQDSGPPDGGTLPAGAAQTFTLVLNVNSGTARGTQLVNTAQVSSTTPDPNPSNNSQALNSYVTAPADVAVTSSGPASVRAGQTVTYVLTVQDNGPNDAQAVTLSDPIMSGATLRSFAQMSGPPFECTAPAVGAGGTIRCFGDDLGPFAVATFNLALQTAANAADGSTLVNVATVTADPTRNLDSNAGNDATVVATRISNPAPPPDLTPPSVTVSGVPATIRLKVLLKKGLRFTESANEPTSWGDSLLGRAGAATLASASSGVFNLTLASRALPLGTGARTVILKPPGGLIGHNKKRFKLELLVTSTDASGNRATLVETITVRV